jgi:hypothetical protein
VAGLGEDPNPILPLALGEADLRRERVQVAREALRKRAQALVLGALEARDRRGGDVARSGQRVWGKPRSTFDVAGSGQREVTTFPRV